MRPVKELSDIDCDIIEDDQSYRYIKILVGIFMIGIVWAVCYYCNDYFSLSNIFVAEKIVAQKISTEKTSGIKFAKIQDIQVGERAIGINPEITNFDREVFLPDPEPATWRKLTLEMIKPDGKRLDITLLRPLNWISESQADVGTTIFLDLPELGAQGLAKILNVDPCPPIKRGKGNVITGTFHHEAANTIDIYVEGLSKPIGCTDNHPFWSVTRDEFVEAGKLQQGEKLQLHNGQTAKVIQILPRPGPERVHNLEVMNEHVYRIAHLGILVHNQYTLTPYQGPGGGHHIFQKAAFNGAGTYNEKKAWALHPSEMNRLNIDHNKVTAEQRRLQSQVAAARYPNNMDIQKSIAIDALVAGMEGNMTLQAKRELATKIVNQAEIQMRGEFGITQPSHLPGYPGYPSSPD